MILNQDRRSRQRCTEFNLICRRFCVWRNPRANASVPDASPETPSSLRQCRYRGASKPGCGAQKIARHLKHECRSRKSQHTKNQNQKKESYNSGPISHSSFIPHSHSLLFPLLVGIELGQKRAFESHFRRFASFRGSTLINIPLVVDQKKALAFSLL